MQIVKTVVWQDGEAWLGYLQEYPDYWTQGESLDDLKEHLKDAVRRSFGRSDSGRAAR
jgi:predicted RNase H-like HicB family nuclease